MNKKDWIKKFDYFVRWPFGDIYANHRIQNGHIGELKYQIKGFNEYGVGGNDLGECNISTMILICCAIEMYGRILLGYDETNDSVSKESFTAFIKTYFPKQYTMVAEEIYKRYRCNLIHSYVTGARGKRGFMLTKNGRQYFDNHLKHVENNRLVINLDLFLNDLKEAFECYFDDLTQNKNKDVKLVTVRKVSLQKNALNSLRDF